MVINLLLPHSNQKMDYNKHFILQKPVNWSLLSHGLSMPISVWNLFLIMDPRIFIHGTSKQIKIIVDNKLFDAVLVNQNYMTICLYDFS